jgi:hypothetical protein
MVVADRGYPGGLLPVTPVTRPINIAFFARRTREQTRDKGVPDPCQPRSELERSGGVEREAERVGTG